MADEKSGRVYAEALFQAALDAGSVARTTAGLRAFADALDTSAPLRTVLFNPQIDESAKARVVGELTRDADKLVANTLRLLLDKGRIGVVGELREEFDRLAAEQAHVVDVEVVSAVPLGGAAEDAVAARIEQATGRHPRLDKRVDPAIIGGLVLRIGDTIVDGSVRSRLDQLRQRLRTAEVRGGDQ